MNLQVYYREVYGKPLCYPGNQAAQLVTQLTCTRTLDEHALTVAKALGHTVEVVPAPPRIPGV